MKLKTKKIIQRISKSECLFIEKINKKNGFWPNKPKERKRGQRLRESDMDRETVQYQFNSEYYKDSLKKKPLLH